ncbi:MAG: hypothetical protein Q9227_006123 [Pyrenula ochraceoflavens]
MPISLDAAGFSDGKNQKNSCRVSFAADEIGRSPAYDSPMSKGIPGKEVPSTENSMAVSAPRPKVYKAIRTLAVRVQELRYIAVAVCDTQRRAGED